MRKRAIALLGMAGAVGALAAREWWQRREDARHFEEGRDYWRLALPLQYSRWVDEHLQMYRIPSGMVGIHLDVYAQPDPAAPIILIAPGMLTYGRLFAVLAHDFYVRGYTVICPDLPGNGFSGGVRGDYTVTDATAAFIDATLWARQRFDGPLYLLGVSLGGALAYAAAAAGAPVAAIACLDLFTFDDRAALKQLVAQPQLLAMLPLLRALAMPFGWVRVPVTWVHRLENIVTPEEAIKLTVWLHDPLPPRALTLRTLVSAATTPPAVPLEENTIPTLVLNQEDDHILEPQITRDCYARLGGPKRYVELPKSAHWSFQPEFWLKLEDEVDAWFQAHGYAGVVPGTGSGRAERAD